MWQWTCYFNGEMMKYDPLMMPLLEHTSVYQHLKQKAQHICLNKFCWIYISRIEYNVNQAHIIFKCSPTIHWTLVCRAWRPHMRKYFTTCYDQQQCQLKLAALRLMSAPRIHQIFGINWQPDDRDTFWFAWFFNLFNILYVLKIMCTYQ